MDGGSAEMVEVTEETFGGHAEPQNHATAGAGDALDAEKREELHSQEEEEEEMDDAQSVASDRTMDLEERDTSALDEVAVIADKVEVEQVERVEEAVGTAPAIVVELVPSAVELSKPVADAAEPVLVQDKYGKKNEAEEAIVSTVTSVEAVSPAAEGALKPVLTSDETGKTAEQEDEKEVEETKAANGTVSETVVVERSEPPAAIEPSQPLATNPSGGTASSSSSSSSDSSSDSSDSSSDSEIEDVTDQYKKPASADDDVTMQTMSEAGDDEVDAEQWFEEHSLEADGIEIVSVVDAQPQGAVDDDDVDVFLLSSDKIKSELERGSATKRRRPEDADHYVETLEDSHAAGEETTSSSDPEQSEDEFRRRRMSSAKLKKLKSRTIKREKAEPRKTPRALTTKSKSAPVLRPTVVYTSVPPKFAVFETIAADDSEFPILKGEYVLKGTHRAHFSGHWGFTESDFARGVVSKFAYSSGYIHGRRDGDTRPFSGAYGGFFNLRQFNGKIMKIKEDHIEFHFLQLSAGDDQPPRDDDPRFEVFGEGQNRYGRFLVRGYFNAENGRMTVRRRYLD